MRLRVLLLFLPLLLGIQGRVLFPEELVSFLSFVYSVIPPFKIGQDSRIGAGFRVGPNADFQVLLELGPQSETQPIGPDANADRETRANRLADLGRYNRRKSLKERTNQNELQNKNLTKTNTNKLEHQNKNLNETSANKLELQNINSTEIST